MSEIIPGILEKDFAEIEDKFEIIRPFSRKVHIDVLDGKFSEEVSFCNLCFSKQPSQPAPAFGTRNSPDNQNL